MAAIKNLQVWCKQQCEGYRDVSITNMTTSFRDGLAFCAILHRHRPELINFSSLSKENVYDNNELAFRVAEEQLGIPALLDAEDMVALKVPDRLSILTYVSQYYNYFHGRSPIGGMSGIKRSTSESSEEPPGKKAVTPTPVKPSPAHLPPVVKTNPAHLVQDLPKENPPATVLGDSSNLRSSSCAICGSHVHLVQRHLVDGKLYHRNCFRCKQCSNTLLSGAYKAGTTPGTYICTSHQQPTRPWNSGLHSTENKPARTSTTSGDPQKVLMKPSQFNKDINSTFNLSNSARPSGSSAGSNFSPGFQNLHAGNKSDLHEDATSPPWTTSRIKTQQGLGIWHSTKWEQKHQVNLQLLGLVLVLSHHNSQLRGFLVLRSTGTLGMILFWVCKGRDLNCNRSTGWVSCRFFSLAISLLIGRANATEDKAETPGDWRTRLKPVANSLAHSVENYQLHIFSVFGASLMWPQGEMVHSSHLLLLFPSSIQADGWHVGIRQHSFLACYFVTQLQEDYIPEEEIQEKVREIEKQLDELELKGVDMEKHLRDCEGDESEDALMADWFKLIHEKQLLLRLESELMYKSKQQKLEEKQGTIESELRHLMSKPENQKTPMEKKREKELLDLYVDTVNNRNDIVECLDEDRIRYGTQGWWEEGKVGSRLLPHSLPNRI
uniref:MICAL like 2 n=1 Tax=Pelusios castaneus TaxID=367368 RepID=A0A8C8SGD5_9SAUR